MTDEPLALRLKRIREDAGLTLQQAADATGKTLAGYQYYERPERFKKAAIPLDIARALAPAVEARGGDGAELLALAGIDAGGTGRADGMADVEMVPYQPNDFAAGRLADAVAALSAGRAHVAPWLIRGQALIHAGYLPGDLVLIDHARHDAPPGSVVCAQLVDWRSGAARTVIRLWEPPYLVAATSLPGYRKPTLVDGTHASLHGLAVACLRVSD